MWCAAPLKHLSYTTYALSKRPKKKNLHLRNVCSKIRQLDKNNFKDALLSQTFLLTISKHCASFSFPPFSCLLLACLRRTIYRAFKGREGLAQRLIYLKGWRHHRLCRQGIDGLSLNHLSWCSFFLASCCFPDWVLNYYPVGKMRNFAIK